MRIQTSCECAAASRVSAAFWSFRAGGLRPVSDPHKPFLPQPYSLATIRDALTPIDRSRVFLFLAALAAAFCAAACTAAFGPGYAIEKQEMEVRFTADPQPVIHIDSVYRLRNDGNRPLASIEVRLPGRRRFNFADPHADWNGHSLSLETSPDNPRNVLLNFP
jgi:hypothetical protein